MLILLGLLASQSFLHTNVDGCTMGEHQWPFAKP
jgi:hypothetical protein